LEDIPPAPKHRFFVPPDTLSGGEHLYLPSDLSRQMRTVLRLRPGARVVLLDGAGCEYLAELSGLHGDQATVRILERRPAPGEPGLYLTLYAALLKGQHLEWVLQKGTELGISAFVPIVTRRTVVRDTGRLHKKRARWERILREAAEQCRRGRLPSLSDPLSFQDACCAAASEHEQAFMPYARAQATGLADALGMLDRPERLALLIGPEGGFDEAEVQQALACGIQIVTLGLRTLRAETAALAAATIVMDRWGELGSRGHTSAAPR
jgi:16S rRNA (uracil1498-N3)-methyltransferase